MTETWCGMLDVLILSIVAGANGVLLSRTSRLREDSRVLRSGSSDDSDL